MGVDERADFSASRKSSDRQERQAAVRRADRVLLTILDTHVAR
jgi:hypothetical protein